MDRIKNTPLGAWLGTAAPDILRTVGGLIAEKAVWPLVQRMLNRRKMSAKDMEHAKLLADASLKNVRADVWKHDNLHGSWLAKNARPLITFASMLGAAIVTVCEATGNHVGELWQGVWATLCISTVGTYFVIQTMKDARGENTHRKRIGRRVDRRHSA